MIVSGGSSQRGCAMTLHIEMARDNRVAVQTFSDPVDIPEVVEIVARLQRDYLDHATKPLHALVDFRRVTKLPSHMLSGVMGPMRKVHPMSGAIVIVTEGAFMSLMAGVLARLVPQYRMYVCKTLDEAWRIIDEIL